MTSPSDGAASRSRNPQPWLQRVVSFLQWLTARESLGPAPTDEPHNPSSPQTNWLRWLLQSEDLPRLPPPRRRSKLGLLAALFTRDKLPPTNGFDQGRKGSGLLRHLLAREKLEAIPPAESKKESNDGS